MKQTYSPPLLPLDKSKVHYESFINELLDATAKLEVYKAKLNDSKVSSSWILPTLQQKEAVSSTRLEGTQATLDGILINQIEPKDDNQDTNEAENYFAATITGIKLLTCNSFSKDFFCELHKILLSGNVRKRKDTTIGDYRTSQNYVGLIGGSHEITYIPPTAEEVNSLMSNLIDYMNNPSDSFQPLIQIAIIHAQMLSIHPFDDGNGRVGRILIPMYLFAKQQIELPCFFISDVLESDKFKYYRLLNETRSNENWDEWIKYFLGAISKQCEKYIYLIDKMNSLYEDILERSKQVIKNNAIVDIIDCLYRHPIFSASVIERETNIPLATINRYLNQLVDNHIIYTDGKKRNKKYYCYDLLELLKI